MTLSARRAVVYVGIVAVVGLVWVVLTATSAVAPIILPAPGGVLRSLARMAADPPAVLGPVWRTFEETAAAFGVATAVAIPLGTVIGASPLLHRAFEPVLATLAVLPLVILYPVLAASMGLGMPSKIALGAVYAFFPVVISTCRAASQVDAGLVAAARSMGAGRLAVAEHVVLPAIASRIAPGLRVGLGLALVTVIAGEFIAGLGGVGYQLAAASQRLDSPTLFAWVVVAIALTVVVNVAFGFPTAVLEKGVNR